MRAHEVEFRITSMDYALGVSTRGYYAWRKRERWARKESDSAFAGRVRANHERSRETYGGRRGSRLSWPTRGSE